VDNGEIIAPSDLIENRDLYIKAAAALHHDRDGGEVLRHRMAAAVFKKIIAAMRADPSFVEYPKITTTLTLAPLYGADEIEKRPNDTVLIVPDRDAADRAKQLFPENMIPVAVPTSSLALCDWRPLAGVDVIVWPEASEEGQSRAKMCCLYAHYAGANTRLADISDDWPADWDLRVVGMRNVGFKKIVADMVKDAPAYPPPANNNAATELSPAPESPDAETPQQKAPPKDKQSGEGQGARTEHWPTIQIKGGSLSANADEAEHVLRLANVDVFRQRGTLVRPVRIMGRDSKGDEVQTPAIADVTVAALRDLLCRHARWERYDERAREWRQKDPPREVADTILHRKGEGKNWRTLAGVTGTPFLRRDGSIAHEHGFDDRSGMFLMDPVALPLMPQRPTKADAEGALAILEGLLVDFPFVDELYRKPAFAEKEAPKHATASASVAVSELLTPMARAAIQFAPMHVNRAPAAGSGKSYLFDIASSIVNGVTCPVISHENEEETEKRLSSEILAGSPIINIDNVNGILTGNLICQVVTQGTVAPRILGKSETPHITNVFTVFANGNNIRVAGDLTRRTLFCSMDAKLDTKDLQQRQFRIDPVRMVLADRGKYIAAALTIMRAHHLAGYPGAREIKPLAGFSDWSRVVRAALVWLGKADPVNSLEVGRAEDPQRAERQAFVEALSETGATTEWSALTAADIVEKSIHVENLKQSIPSKLINPRTGVDTVKLGTWMAAFKSEIFDGKRLKSTTAGKGRLKWYVDEPPAF
jgi:putative DNA primase/helicase